MFRAYKSSSCLLTDGQCHLKGLGPDPVFLPGVYLVCGHLCCQVMTHFSKTHLTSQTNMCEQIFESEPWPALVHLREGIQRGGGETFLVISAFCIKQTTLKSNSQTFLKYATFYRSSARGHMALVWPPIRASTRNLFSPWSLVLPGHDLQFQKALDGLNKHVRADFILGPDLHLWDKRVVCNQQIFHEI